MKTIAPAVFVLAILARGGTPGTAPKVAIDGNRWARCSDRPFDSRGRVTLAQPRKQS